MSDVAHFTVTTDNLVMSPRSVVGERTLDMLKPIARAGFGTVAGLSILLETHRVDNDAEAWVFTLGYGTEPAVRCWLSRTRNPDLWQFGIPEPPAPWLAVAFLDEAATLTHEQVFILEEAERCVAWAFLELQQIQG
jgi:hypothetical protein